MKERQQNILVLIVKEFIKSSTPVSSKMVVEMMKNKCSSATIRNEMMILENKGLIEKPHSSSGSIPTSKGYRYYLNNNNDQDTFQDLKNSIGTIFKNRANSIDSIIEQSCYLISDILKLPVVIFKNQNDNQTKRLQSIQLIKLEKNKCMLVVIADNKVVAEKILDLNEKVIEDLQKSINIISKRIFNSPLSEVNERLELLIPILTENIESFENKLKSVVLEVFKKALLKVDVFGRDNMLKLPELKNPKILQSMVSLLDMKNIWQLLSENFLPLNNSEDTKLGFLEDDQLSVISTKINDQLTLAVVGTKRAEYSKIFTALKILRENLNRNKTLLSFEIIKNIGSNEPQEV